MSHELPDSLSVLLFKSTYHKNGNRISNIVCSAPHVTIPRHLRGIFINEYGIANLFEQSDEECIKRLLLITDSEFQEELLELAKKDGKLSQDWQIPEFARNNTPRKIEAFVSKHRAQFPRFPFGSDFTTEEEHLQEALLNLKDMGKPELLKTLARGFLTSEKEFKRELKRMDYVNTTGFKNLIYKNVLKGALSQLS